MATNKIKQANNYQFGGFTPYGNSTVLRFGFGTNADGTVQDSTTGAAPAVGDKLDLGSLPAGFHPDDMQVIVSTAMTASVTGSLGFEYADGIDHPDIPQDAAYFGAGLVLNAAGRLRLATTKAPVTLPKEARLILTFAGAANAKASRVDITLTGERYGAA
ncbi:hypothetical protein C8245_22945 [Paracidovorax avenae]|uniref:hypothetical protein n=1 Tax=Paracidovorax avenae TaxID=80867 RepID=UPI000D21FECB|nr:hypothetical protein [Paracidovorax avenae]AVS68138.1 hypothetical protein C8245_22945 [Paracidovorax avenae]